MKTRIWLPVLLLTSLASRADHPDEDRRFRAVLVGTEETPAIFTPGTGRLTARVVDHGTRIEFTLTYANLTAPPAVAHVHFGQRNVAGGVALLLRRRRESRHALLPTPARSPAASSRQT